MFGFLKFLILCVLAVAAGVAAVAIPIDGKTAADHVRAFVEGNSGGAKPAPPPAEGSPPRMARKRPSAPEPKEPADDHTEEDRAALKELIGSKVR
jgi:hypothetical protein